MAEKIEKAAAAPDSAAPTLIALSASYVDNSLRERGEGDVISLGYGPGEIDPDRAAYLVAESLATYDIDA